MYDIKKSLKKEYVKLVSNINNYENEQEFIDLFNSLKFITNYLKIDDQNRENQLISFDFNHLRNISGNPINHLYNLYHIQRSFFGLDILYKDDLLLKELEYLNSIDNLYEGFELVDRSKYDNNLIDRAYLEDFEYILYFLKYSQYNYKNEPQTDIIKVSDILLDKFSEHCIVNKNLPNRYEILAKSNQIIANNFHKDTIIDICNNSTDIKDLISILEFKGFRGNYLSKNISRNSKFPAILIKKRDNYSYTEIANRYLVDFIENSIDNIDMIDKLNNNLHNNLYKDVLATNRLSELLLSDENYLGIKLKMLNIQHHLLSNIYLEDSKLNIRLKIKYPKTSSSLEAIYNSIKEYIDSDSFLTSSSLEFIDFYIIKDLFSDINIINKPNTLDYNRLKDKIERYLINLKDRGISPIDPKISYDLILNLKQPNSNLYSSVKLLLKKDDSVDVNAIYNHYSNLQIKSFIKEIKSSNIYLDKNIIDL
jgi:hypothetical protein